MRDFLLKLQNILSRFLGKPYREITDDGQLQFGCPRCIENYGESEREKHNLEVNVRIGRFNCWKCSSINDEMHGSIFKLIKMYGTEDILKEYLDAIKEFKGSKLYELKYKKDDFNIETDFLFDTSLQLPDMYIKFNKNGFNYERPLKYLLDRGIGWDIIEYYELGYTLYDKTQTKLSTRIIIPSYDAFGQLNYWTGRNYSERTFMQKYYNPNIERKSIIFNENKVQWDADITLVEGPFDHIVVPNSIPLLGKSLKPDFEIYNKLMRYANANVNIFLDGDAFKDVKKLYSLLNQGKLYGKIRYVPVNEELDPSEIYKKWGKRGIVDHLNNAQQISDVYLT